MNGRIVLVLFCLVFLVCFQYFDPYYGSVVASDGNPVHNLNTGLNYATMQEAINANETREGDVIHVDAGTYFVNDTVYNLIDKSISLVGDGIGNTTIIGTAIGIAMTQDIFYVASDNVNISGFTIRNGWYGVDVNANHVHISDCNISDNKIGIQMDSQWPGHYLVGEIIEGNFFTNNSGIAIQIAANGSTISRNVISDNGGGISVMEGSNNIIYGNTIRNNGPFHPGCVAGGSNNTIILNNILNNTLQAASAPSTNMWDGRLNSGDLLWGGNSWSDYNETNKYGLGTDPYVIDANSIDHHPLTGMVNIFDVPYGYDVTVVSNSSVSDFGFTVSNGSQAAIDFRVTGENGTRGFCWIIVPQAAINYTQTWTVTMDGNPLKTYEYSLATNETHWNFWIDYPQSTHQIEITGATTLPEFPTFLTPILLTVIVLLAVLDYRRKH